jgi:hypothetical protein
MLIGGLMDFVRVSKDNTKPTTISEASILPAVSEVLS